MYANFKQQSLLKLECKINPTIYFYYLPTEKIDQYHVMHHGNWGTLELTKKKTPRHQNLKNKI